MKSGIAEGLLAKIIAAYLQRDSNRVVIQNFEARRSDPSFKDDPMRSVYKEELLWELCGPDLAEKKIESCVWDASYLPWLGYFCRARETVASGRELTEDDLRDVATRLVGIAVQALHDSYVIWWRTDIEPFPSVPELRQR